MKLAAKRERGVTSTTTSAIFQLMANMNASVPMMVMTPVKSWEKPMSSPSENWSASVMMRLTISPCAWESI